VRLCLERGLPVDAIADVLALWAWCTVHHPVHDPLSARLAEIADAHPDDTEGLAAVAAELLRLEPIFGDLVGNGVLTAAVQAAAGRAYSPMRDPSGR
jgi:hypothetical protein